jgi:hypothetical protein
MPDTASSIPSATPPPAAAAAAPVAPPAAPSAARASRVGDIVHFVDKGGQHVPGILTRVVDAARDIHHFSVHRQTHQWTVTNVPRDEATHAVGTWHAADDTTESAGATVPGNPPGSGTAPAELGEHASA